MGPSLASIYICLPDFQHYNNRFANGVKVFVLPRCVACNAILPIPVALTDVGSKYVEACVFPKIVKIGYELILCAALEGSSRVCLAVLNAYNLDRLGPKYESQNLALSGLWLQLTRWKYAQNFRPIKYREPAVLGRVCLGTMRCSLRAPRGAVGAANTTAPLARIEE